MLGTYRAFGEVMTYLENTRLRQTVVDVISEVHQDWAVTLEHNLTINIVVSLSPEITYVFGTTNENWGADVMVDGEYHTSINTELPSNCPIPGTIVRMILAYLS